MSATVQRDRRRRVDATGRSEGGSPHVRFYAWEIESPAFRALSPVARCVLLELKALYNGRNNGALFLSAREAGRRVGVGRTKAWECLRELQGCGFIRPSRPGGFSWKTGARRGDATCWELTEFPIGDLKGPGTRDFMRRPKALPDFDQRLAGADALAATANVPSAAADAVSWNTGNDPPRRTEVAIGEGGPVRGGGHR
jgi:hypothetical protein